MPLARGTRGYKQHAAELMRYIDRLGEFVKQVGQCHVVLVSLIPSPDHNYKCKWAFKHFSKLLKEHAFANQDVFTFCDVKPIFMKNHIEFAFIVSHNLINYLRFSNNNESSTFLQK